MLQIWPNQRWSKSGSIALSRRLFIRLTCAFGLAGEAAGYAAEAGDFSGPDQRYLLGPDSEPQAGVPEGRVSEVWIDNSKTYPGVAHRCWIYVPAQYDGRRAIPAMVFLDGTVFALRDGSFRVPIVLNNLIGRKDIPVMAAIFVDSGVTLHGDPYGKAVDGSPLGQDGAAYRRSIRSIEYETISPTFADFLTEEIFPTARKIVQITDDPDGRGIAGESSGANAAVTAAWERPDQFRKVFSALGSYPFVLRGKTGLPHLIRDSDRKPIRFFLQDGANDVAFPIAPEWGSGDERNSGLVKVLKVKGYDYQYVFGEGAHDPAHAASIFPEAMRWLWRDYLP